MASGQSLSPEKQTKYRSGVGKLLYLTKWSRPEIANSVRELTRFMTRAYPANYKAMERVMQHVLSTPDRGVIMQPNTDWDGNNKFLFTVDGMSDSGDATEPESRRRCGGLQVFLNKSPIAHKSKMQSSASLSMAEGELIAACDAAQIMLFVMHCCATQLPVAPRSRLRGYGAWQHAPGTSHQLTHVLWCQLILRILDQ